MDYCFTGNSRVFINNNNQKYWTTVNELKKGDLVKSNFTLHNNGDNNNNISHNNTNVSNNGPHSRINTNNNITYNCNVNVSQNELYAEVECIVKIKCQDQYAQLIKINKITSSGKISSDYMHTVPIIPIQSTEPGFKWIQPKFIGNVKYFPCDYLYCIIFKNNQRSTINVNNRIFGVIGNKMNDSVTVHPFFTYDVAIQFLKKMLGWEKGFITLSERAILRDNNGVIKGLNPEFEIISS